MREKTSFYCRALFLLATLVLLAGCGSPDGNDPWNSRSETSTEAWQVFESPVIQTRKTAQVAVIVEDIEKSAEFYASMFGINKPNAIVAAGHESRPTMYRGKPSDATAKLAFIELENIQIELLHNY